jgi:glyceraldehyde-3-phosphate dehydrogenase/erythrose-4-phosphate dehydrogenase
VIGNPHSSVFDSRLTDARGDGYLRAVAWYDNEWGYSNRVVDLVRRMAMVEARGVSDGGSGGESR